MDSDTEKCVQKKEYLMCWWVGRMGDAGSVL